MKQNCERCFRPLNLVSKDAYICSYECTFCSECAIEEFHNICPNCGGELLLRPSRIIPSEKGTDTDQTS